MKYAPKQVYIKSESGYEEISYDELLRRTEADASYKDKLFIPLHGVLMEVSRQDYSEFHKIYERAKYIHKLEVKYGLLSIEGFDTEDENGADYISDEDENVSEKACINLMKEKLYQVLPLLSENERILIQQHFFDEISQTELARHYGINQSSISRRIDKILAKLKKLIEI